MFVSVDVSFLDLFFRYINYFSHVAVYYRKVIGSYYF